MTPACEGACRQAPAGQREGLEAGAARPRRSSRARPAGHLAMCSGASRTSVIVASVGRGWSTRRT